MPSGAAASQAQAHGQGQNGGDKHGNGESGTAVSHHAVQLQADGSLAGHINLLDPNTGAHREVTDLTLHFIRRGELVASTAGVGHMMSIAGATFQTDKVFVGIILLAGTGYVLTEILKYVELRFASWRPN